MSYRGVIFDVDGTLVDSNEAHARAWQQAMAEHGYQVELEQVKRLIGMGGDQLLPELIGLEIASPEGKAIGERRSAIFKEHYLPTLRALPGAQELVARLHADGYALVVASSAVQEELGPLLEIAGVADLLTRRTSADDAERSKPHPDIVLAALAQLGLPADQVAMIGDTPYDVEAAGKAGVRVIGLRSGGWDEAGLKGALAVYEHPADLLARLDQSPLARERAL